MSVNILDTQSTLEKIKERMNISRKVFFIRFGDNDVCHMKGKDPYGRIMNGEEGIGRNRTKFSRQLQADLSRSFNIYHRDYLIGLTGQWPKEKGMRPGVFGSKRYQTVLDYVSEIANQQTYLNPIVFHYLFVFEPKILKEFFDNYLTGKVLFVGSADGSKLFGDVDQVETQAKNAYEQKGKIWREVKKKIQNNKYDVVILACGQLGRAMAHHLWEMVESFHCIDIGSMVDVFDGKVTRRWIKKTNAHENIKYFT